MNRKLQAITLGVFLIFGALGCGITDSLLSSVTGGSKSNSVANLWSDVPALPGAQKLDIQLPATVQLAIQAMVKAGSATGDVSLDQFDWIAYSTTQTPDQVTAYYSTDRMSQLGWGGKDQPGCNAGSDTSGLGGGFCIFTKGSATPNDKGAVLFIVLAQEDKTKPTQVFYVRLAGVVNKTPTQ